MRVRNFDDVTRSTETLSSESLQTFIMLKEMVGIGLNSLKSSYKNINFGESRNIDDKEDKGR